MTSFKQQFPAAANETVASLFLDPFPFLTNPFNFKQQQNDSFIDSNNNTTTSGDCFSIKGRMEGLFFNELVLYVCLSLTSLVTALVASKTLYRFQKHLNLIFGLVRTHLEDWFMFLFTAFWLIAVHPPYGMCVLWRNIVTVYMKVRYGSLGDIATGLDSAGSVDSLESRQIIKSLKVLKGKCDLDEFRKRVAQTACKQDPKTGELMHPKFHQYLDTCGGFYCWKPAQFDINHHVRFVDGFNEKSKSLSESEALKIVSKMSNTPFNTTRGYWEILVIPKFHYDWEESIPEKERESKFSILIRISHGIGDGFSFLKLVMRDMAGADAGDYVPPSKPSTSPFYYKVFVFLYLFFKTPRAFYSEMKLKDVNPFHNPEIKMTGEKIHVWSPAINIEWLKKLKNELGYGMSTILLETLSGACRRYMTQQLGLPEANLPKIMHAIIPVPAPNHPDNKLVNKFSIVMMPLELKTENVSDRCRLIEREARVMARSPDSYMNLFLMDLVAVFPISLAKFFMVNKQCTTVISNLPGPKKSITIWGYPLADTMFWLPNVGSSGISVSYLSYENKMRLGIAVDTGVIPNTEAAQLLQDWMIEDLQALATSVNVSLENMFIKTGTTAQIPQVNVESKEESNIEDEIEDHGYGDGASTDDDNNENDKCLKSSQENSSLIFRSRKELSNKFKTQSLDAIDVDKRFLATNSVTICPSVKCLNKTHQDTSQSNSNHHHHRCLQGGRS